MDCVSFNCKELKHCVSILKIKSPMNANDCRYAIFPLYYIIQSNLKLNKQSESKSKKSNKSSCKT